MYLLAALFSENLPKSLILFSKAGVSTAAAFWLCAETAANVSVCSTGAARIRAHTKSRALTVVSLFLRSIIYLIYVHPILDDGRLESGMLKPL